MTPSSGAQKAGYGLCHGLYCTGWQIVLTNCSQKGNTHLKNPRSQLHGPHLGLFRGPLARRDRSMVTYLEKKGNECLFNSGLVGGK